MNDFIFFSNKKGSFNLIFNKIIILIVLLNIKLK